MGFNNSKRAMGVLLFFFLLVLCQGQTAPAAGMDPNAKWAWGANLGWFNFNPSIGGDVAVYEDHLEGYIWNENVGWIRLGTHTGGSNYTYANTAADNYGVNRDPGGRLSGYGWGENIGWINFAPTGGGVNIDPRTGVFSGYAWGENVGWINLKGGSGPTAFGVVTDFRRFLIYLPLILKTSG